MGKDRALMKSPTSWKRFSGLLAASAATGLLVGVALIGFPGCGGGGGGNGGAGGNLTRTGHSPGGFLAASLITASVGIRPRRLRRTGPSSSKTPEPNRRCSSSPTPITDRFLLASPIPRAAPRPRSVQSRPDWRCCFSPPARLPCLPTSR